MTMTSDSAQFAISVVVPSHDRVQSVLRLLGSLNTQRRVVSNVADSQFEVIVVADGCSDGTVTVLQETIAAAQWSFPLVIIAHATALGSGVARNAGAAVARGTTLLFIDDDIEPFHGMVAEHASRHAAARESGHELVLVGAPVPVRPLDANFEEIAAWGWWEQQFERMSQPGHRFTHDEIFTGVLSLSAATFRAIGGFDVSLTHCHEDSELGLRLFRLGVRAGFTRTGGGMHHDVRGIARLLPRKEAEGRADVLLLQRWPELVRVSPLAGARDRVPLSIQLLLDGAFSDAAGLWKRFTNAALTSLPLLEKLKWRKTWRAVQGAVLFHSYWRGAAAQVGSRAALRALLQASESAADAWTAECRHLVLDLADGIEVAERVLDQFRPDALSVAIGSLHVGSIVTPVNAERLHGGHLRRILATHIASELRVALWTCDVYAAEVVAMPTAGPRRGPSIGVAAITKPTHDDSERNDNHATVAVMQHGHHG